VQSAGNTIDIMLAQANADNSSLFLHHIIESLVTITFPYKALKHSYNTLMC